MSWTVNTKVFVVRYEKYPYPIYGISLTYDEAIKFRNKLHYKINFIDGKWDEYPTKFEITEMNLISDEALNELLKYNILA